MPAYGARVGVRGGERTVGHGAHVLEACVVQVRHVHGNAPPLQLAHRDAPERGQAVRRVVAAAERVGPVPRERDHAHARLRERVEPRLGGAVVLQKRRALHGEEARRLAGGERRFHVARRAGRCEGVSATRKLAFPHAPHALEERPRRVAAHLVGNERREALAPRETRRPRERDVRVVVGERGKALGRDAGVMLREPTRHGRVAMEGDAVERVAVQVEHAQPAIGRAPLPRRQEQSHFPPLPVRQHAGLFTGAPSPPAGRPSSPGTPCRS